MLRCVVSAAAVLLALVAMSVGANAFCERECVTICRQTAAHIQGCIRDHCPQHRSDACVGAAKVRQYVRRYNAEHGSVHARRNSKCSGGFNGCVAYSESLGWTVGAATHYCGRRCSQ